jgi:hypothetical protein
MQRYAAAMSNPAAQILGALGEAIQTLGEQEHVLSSKADNEKYFVPLVNAAYDQLVAAGYPPPGNCLAQAVWGADYRCLLASLRSGVSETPAGPMDCSAALASFQACCAGSPCPNTEIAPPTTLSAGAPFAQGAPAEGVPVPFMRAATVKTIVVPSQVNTAALNLPPCDPTPIRIGPFESPNGTCPGPIVYLG